MHLCKIWTLSVQLLSYFRRTDGQTRRFHKPRLGLPTYKHGTRMRINYPTQNSEFILQRKQQSEIFLVSCLLSKSTSHMLLNILKNHLAASSRIKGWLGPTISMFMSIYVILSPLKAGRMKQLTLTLTPPITSDLALFEEALCHSTFLSLS